VLTVPRSGSPKPPGSELWKHRSRKKCGRTEVWTMTRDDPGRRLLPRGLRTKVDPVFVPQPSEDRPHDFAMSASHRTRSSGTSRSQFSAESRPGKSSSAGSVSKPSSLASGATVCSHLRRGLETIRVMPRGTKMPTRARASPNLAGSAVVARRCPSTRPWSPREHDEGGGSSTPSRGLGVLSRKSSAG
jgi:hypothetical protein